MSLYALCYPSLAEADDQFIRSYRNEHDLPYRDVVKHHFTMVFGIDDLDTDTFVDHVHGIAESQKPIPFVCRYAMLADDAESDDYYVFLVPDEGFSEISLLHDRLYTGELARFHRIEIPYVPHIGIATIADAPRVKRLCDELNQGDLEIAGILGDITVSEYDGTKITDLDSFTFDGQRRQ